MLDVLSAAANRRSIRRFLQKAVPKEAITAMIKSARLAPTGMNRQPLQFAAILERSLCEAIFPHTGWAKLIPDGSAGPDAATQPMAYIAILVDRNIAKSADTDAGAAGMSVLLAAEAQGIASCWLASLERGPILTLLGLSQERFALHTLVALGYPAMESKTVEMTGEGTSYFLAPDGTLCVPKRPERDIVHWFE